MATYQIPFSVQVCYPILSLRKIKIIFEAKRILASVKFIQHNHRGYLHPVIHRHKHRYSIISIFSPRAFLLRLIYMSSYATDHHLNSGYFQCQFLCWLSHCRSKKVHKHTVTHFIGLLMVNISQIAVLVCNYWAMCREFIYITLTVLTTVNYITLLQFMS